MNDLRRALVVGVGVVALGLLGAAGTAAGSSDPEPSDVPATEAPDPEPTDPPSTDSPTTDPAEPQDESSDDSSDAYIVAAVLGFAFLIVVAAWVMVNRQDDDVGPQAEPPTSL